MKVILFNGSPNSEGCIESGRKAGIEVEYVEKDVWTNFVE